jgi:hypothetical protein
MYLVRIDLFTMDEHFSIKFLPKDTMFSWKPEGNILGHIYQVIIAF